MQSKTEALDQLKEKLHADTTLPLYDYRRTHHYLPVLGGGNPDTQLLFIGEAPGENEAKQGKPFCGAAGRILDELFESVSIQRDDVYITNIVKDRPPENRDPFPNEISAYAPYLTEQLRIIQPKIIVTLGRFSMRWVLELFKLDASKTISQVHGKVFTGKVSYGVVQIVPFFHPASALYDPQKKRLMAADMHVLKTLIEKI